MIKIEVHDPIYSSCNKEAIKLIKPCLAYKATTFIQGQYRKIQKNYETYVINKHGTFYTGLIPHIQAFCQKQNYEIQINYSETMKDIESEVQPTNGHSLPGITLRPDQERLVQSAIEKRRGVIVAPTGAGKTIIMLSVLKAFEGKNILIIVPTLAILKQTTEELARLGFKGVSALGDGNKTLIGRTIVSTMQTFVKIDLAKYGHLFDVVCIDEGHKAIKSSYNPKIRKRELSTIQKIMSQMPAPVRIAFTATPPKEGTERYLNLTGLTGGIIDMVSWGEGQEIGMLAEPYLVLIPIPKHPRLHGLGYKATYSEGIVNYSLRNKIIMNEVKKLQDRGKTSLVFVIELDHGENLYKAGQKLKVDCVYLNGSTDTMDRNIAKKKLTNKEISCIICTKIFVEGVNIPTLDAVMLAHGGKSDTDIQQRIGRGLRRAEGKDVAYIYDFLDESEFLASHLVSRLRVYQNLGLI